MGEWVKRGALLWPIVHATVVLALASRLPADAWFVGDPGVKLIATEQVLAHPWRPFEIDPPPAIRDALDQFPQPFFLPHAEHAHAVTSPLLPILTAPFVALLGLRGAYVLPALGWLLAVPLTVRIAEAIGARTSPAVLSIAGIAASPLLFYGLEFWEHAPAVAGVAGAAALVLAPSPTLARVSAAGACAGLAVWLRPEAIWWSIAIGAAAALHHRSWRWAVPFGGGAAAALAPLALYNVAHAGTMLGPHVGTNVAVLGDHWMAARATLTSLWLLPTRALTRVFVWGLAGAWMIAWLFRRSGRDTGRRALHDLGVMAGLVLVVLLMSEMAQGHEVRENLWRVFPVAILAFLPGVAAARHRHLLWMLALAPVAGAILTAPNDGGGQWGPRYLLPSVPFLLILAVDSLGSLGARFERPIIWLGFAALIAGLLVSRTAWIELSETKQTYSQLVHDTAAQFQGASYVVTDVWWLGQMHAAVIDADRVLFVESDRGAALLSRLGGEDTLLVQAADQPTRPAAAWVDGTCYRAQPSVTIGGGRLIATRLSCR